MLFSCSRSVTIFDDAGTSSPAIREVASTYDEAMEANQTLSALEKLTRVMHFSTLAANMYGIVTCGMLT